MVLGGESMGVFVLAFVVEFEVGYNPLCTKLNYKNYFLLFSLAFSVSSTHKTPPPPQKQTPFIFILLGLN
jgi:hypothetical protein